jgi:hypothetical protein
MLHVPAKATNGAAAGADEGEDGGSEDEKCDAGAGCFHSEVIMLTVAGFGKGE